MRDYQRQFIDFLVASSALQFGSFTLKSGRVSPYFVNTGKFDTGSAIDRLGAVYAAAIQERFPSVNVVFGPAYKGIPLAVAAAMHLATDFHRDAIGYTFDRKERKDHGDKGPTVGRSLADGDHVVLVDDVFTTGQTKEEALTLLHSIAQVTIDGLVIAVDRREQGKNGENAIAEFTKTTGIPVHAIVSIHDILEHLTGSAIDAPTAERIQQYLATYGVD